ncbi:protein FAM47E-like isoform X2 [Sceloporus undulatus]|uniref:protein FAM47E-like isoform X2 n=1 Tax=Sceloporus undulatus TaxID=8520 RepID=UPI001C4DCE81|nr:protein FAM47E-like isoform X2 [Sceloporus undulatus]
MYKEKLPSKCFHECIVNKKRFSDALNGQRWRFLKSGIDDFRNGCPPPSDNIIIRGKMGPVPIILQYKKPDTSQIMPYKAAELQTKSDIIYSKLSPAQKAKKDYIAQTEHCLAQHPLALYPHLEESVPPELFCDVVRLLDPEMHLSRGSFHDYQTHRDLHTTVQYQVPRDTKPETRHTPTVPVWLPKKKNPYTWLSEKEVAEREKAAKIAYIPPLDENVKRVTKEFCEWVSAMGGENNIDEATIMELFDTRYESKAKASSPIKIVELYHVPGELRECEGKVSWGSVKKIKRVPSEPKCEKIKYGAWYLHPKKWKKKKAGEQDKIPDCLQFFLNLREKNIPKDQTDEMPLHGTYAFEQFLESKGYRKPAFLLQMLAASSPEKVLLDGSDYSRRLSMKYFEDLRVRSSSIFKDV